MTDKFICTIINRFNRGEIVETESITHLSSLVFHSKVLSNKFYSAKTNKFYSIPLNFYFIKNFEGIIIGAVHIMESDFHWYVKNGHRKKGYLSKALKDVILPHLNHLGVIIQRISINKLILSKRNCLNSMRVAENCGFKVIENCYDKIILELELKNCSNFYT